MKRLFTLLTFFALTATAWAQSFSDDFESYSPGEYVGEQSEMWTTWSGTTGGTEDIAVVDDKSVSGSNSIFIESNTAGGGPQDGLLIVGDNISEGILTIGSQMYIASGRVGYFNFQATPVPGSVWTLDFTAEGGNILLTEGATTLATATYNEDEWFTWEVVANMSLNIWEFYVNDELAGTFSSGSNTVSTVDIFGIEDAKYWIDDIHYDWEEYVIPDLNLSALGLEGIGALAGLPYTPTATVRNNGLTDINSFDASVDYNGSVYTQSITGVTLTPGEYMEVDFDDAITMDAGQQEVELTVSNVNGGPDDYADDDSFTFQTTLVEVAAGKRAVVEEGTGTWCQYCPRGAVTMARMSDLYGSSYTGIAVHNGDPMAVTEYDSGLSLSGFPGGRVDRGSELGDGQFEQKWLERMTVAPKTYVTVGAQFDEQTRLLEVVLTMECVEGATGSYRPGLVITEDSVTGTSSGYAQINAFSGQDVDMGGYEDLPNPVPADMMVYDHVGRSIMPDYNGAEGFVPDPLVMGETYAVNFEMTVPEEWDVDHLGLVGMLYGPSRTDNSYAATLQEAIDEGWYDSGNLVTGIQKLPEPDAEISLYPNPSQGMAYLDLDLNAADEVSVIVQTVEGKIVSSHNYGVLSGASRLPINTSNYAKGLYMIQVKIGNTQTTRKLLVD